MKTLIIYNDTESDISFLIVDGDYSRFNNIIFKGSLDTDVEQECNDWLWTNEGQIKHEFSYDTSLVENKQWDKIAIITFVP